MPLHCCKKHAGWLAFMMLLFAPAASWADNKAAAIDEMEGYLEFVDYGGGVIFAEQIPKDEWPKMVVIMLAMPLNLPKTISRVRFTWIGDKCWPSAIASPKTSPF